MVYREYKSFCPFVRIGSPTPFPASECVSPLGPKGVRHNTPLRVRGWGPNQTTGQKAWHSVYSVQYCEQYFSHHGPSCRKVYGGDPRQLIKTGIKPYLSHFPRLLIREDWMPRDPRSSSFWVPRNLSHHKIMQARTGDKVLVKSREITGAVVAEGRRVKD